MYVSKKGYVSIEIYSADCMVSDYCAQMLGSTVKKHMKIYKVSVHSRSSLVKATHKLLEVVYNDKAEELLRLVLEYATSKTKLTRDGVVEELRRLLNEEKANAKNVEDKKTSY